MSICTCKIYKILNRVQESENVEICTLKKNKKLKKVTWEYIPLKEKLVIRVDSYLKNQ